MESQQPKGIGSLQSDNENNPYFKKGVDPTRKIEITQQQLWDLCHMCYKDGRLAVFIETINTPQNG